MKKIVDSSSYKSRLVDPLIDRSLGIFGAVCVEGPKWCGKTWTSSYHANSEFLVGDPSGNFSNRMMAEIEPYGVLKGETPRLIDEWQEVPSLWDATRAYVDMGTKKGQIILTGSSTPINKGVMHSGTGRIRSIRMNTMSLFESGDSNGEVSLGGIAKGVFEPHLVDGPTLERLAYLTVRGGWPGNLLSSYEDCGELSLSYMEGVLKSDLNRLDPGSAYNERTARKILMSLARNESTTASDRTLLRDLSGNEGGSIGVNTLTRYLSAFERMFLFQNIDPFSPNFRSSLRVKQSQKRHFSDPAMACALLNLTPSKLLGDLNTFGFLFESLVERDLAVYAQSLGGKLFHYRDYRGNEIDAIVELADGNYIAIEIKLGLNKAEEGAANLARVCKAIENEGGKGPAAKCVIYGVGGASYRNEEGVYVFPITSLKN